MATIATWEPGSGSGPFPANRSLSQTYFTLDHLRALRLYG